MSLLNYNNDGKVLTVYTLEEARKHTGLTWRKFCETVNIPLSTYQLIESGKRVPNMTQRKSLDEYYIAQDIAISFPNRICEDFTLRGLRKWYGYTQAEVAEELGVSRDAYAHWERGTFKPSFDAYWQLVEMYKVPLAMNILGNGRIENLAWGRLKVPTDFVQVE